MKSQTGDLQVPSPSVQAELLEMDAAYVAAFNAGDAHGLAGFFTETCMVMNTFGDVLVGRAAVEGALKRAFDGPFHGATLRITPRSEQLLSENIVVQQGASRTIRSSDVDDFRDFAYTKVFVRQSPGWKLAVAQFALLERGKGQPP